MLRYDEFNARYAWCMPFAGMGLAVIINFFVNIFAPPGYRAIGGIFFILGLIVGIIYTLLCFVKSFSAQSYIKHGIGGIAVNGFMIYLLVPILPGGKIDEMLKPKYIADATAENYQIVYSDDKTKLCCKLPPEYTAVSLAEGDIPDSLFTYKNSTMFVTCVELDGRIAKPKKITYEINKLRKSGIKCQSVKWGRFNVIAIFVYDKDRIHNDIVTVNIQIPTLPKAIQVSLFGLRADEQQIEKRIPEVLRGIEGYTNWK
ncbi:MAG: hypothetical protein JW860_05305 [Sedimentisphaerales bacterium]|nr:hypothetical protein [Sedimentisphaerales bacterium]